MYRKFDFNEKMPKKAFSLVHSWTLSVTDTKKKDFISVSLSMEVFSSLLFQIGEQKWKNSMLAHFFYFFLLSGCVFGLTTNNFIFYTVKKQILFYLMACNTITFYRKVVVYVCIYFYSMQRKFALPGWGHASSLK